MFVKELTDAAQQTALAADRNQLASHRELAASAVVFRPLKPALGRHTDEAGALVIARLQLNLGVRDEHRKLVTTR